MRKTYWIKLDEDDVVRDIVSYPADGFSPIELDDPIPYGFTNGYYRYSSRTGLVAVDDALHRMYLMAQRPEDYEALREKIDAISIPEPEKTEWFRLTPLNGMRDTGQGIRVSKDKNGLVSLRGRVKMVNTIPVTNIILPEGYRPAGSLTLGISGDHPTPIGEIITPVRILMTGNMIFTPSIGAEDRILILDTIPAFVAVED